MTAFYSFRTPDSTIILIAGRPLLSQFCSFYPTAT